MHIYSCFRRERGRRIYVEIVFFFKNGFLNILTKETSKLAYSVDKCFVTEWRTTGPRTELKLSGQQPHIYFIDIWQSITQT